MKLLRKISIRMRITLFTGFLILSACMLLTAISMYNANDKLAIAAHEITSSDMPVIMGPLPASDATTFALSQSTVKYSMTLPSVDISSAKTGSEVVSPSDGNSDTRQDAYFISVTQKINTARRSFNLWSIIYMAVIAVLGMFGAYWISGTALKPVHTLNKTVCGISEENLSARIPSSGARDEVASLTDSFNIMLDRLNDSFVRQKRFASNAAHELKTPVATIKMGIQALDLEGQPDLNDYKEVIGVTKRNITRLSAVIDDLLTLTRENGTYATDMLSIQALLKGIARDLQIKYQDIPILLRLDGEESFILCSETLTYRLFYNLIENGLKYNKKGGNVTLSVKEFPNEIRIHIADTGMGIEPEHLEHIWEPFYCVNDSRSRELGGAGLGLSIVRTIADQFGWQIDIQSAVNVGTVFEVIIPKDIKDE